MGLDHSFDIVSRIDLQEVANAVNVTLKEIRNRFDFRNSRVDITLEKDKMTPRRRGRPQDQGPAAGPRREAGQAEGPPAGPRVPPHRGRGQPDGQAGGRLPGRHPHREGPRDRQAGQGGEVQGPGGHPGRRGPGLLGEDRRPPGGHRLPQGEGPRHPHAVRELPMTSPTPLVDRWSSVAKWNDMSSLYKEIRSDLDRVEDRLESWSRSSNPLTAEISRYVLRKKGQAAPPGARPADLPALQPGQRGVGLPGLARRAPPHGQPHPRRHRRQRRRPPGQGIGPRQVGPEHHRPPRGLSLHQVHRPVPAVPPRAGHPPPGRRLGPDDRRRARRVRRVGRPPDHGGAVPGHRREQDRRPLRRLLPHRGHPRPGLARGGGGRRRLRPEPGQDLPDRRRPARFHRGRPRPRQARSCPTSARGGSPCPSSRRSSPTAGSGGSGSSRWSGGRTSRRRSGAGSSRAWPPPGPSITRPGGPGNSPRSRSKPSIPSRKRRRARRSSGWPSSASCGSAEGREAGTP